MTERFTYKYGKLFDNNYNTFYPIEDSEENIELFCNRLNKLNDENEQLKTFLKKNCPMCRCNLKLFYEESKQRGDLDD